MRVLVNNFYSHFDLRPSRVIDIARGRSPAMTFVSRLDESAIFYKPVEYWQMLRPDKMLNDRAALRTPRENSDFTTVPSFGRVFPRVRIVRTRYRARNGIKFACVSLTLHSQLPLFLYEAKTASGHGYFNEDPASRYRQQLRFRFNYLLFNSIVCTFHGSIAR